MFDLIGEMLEYAASCECFNPYRSATGFCNRHGYAPFDCHNCNSYVPKEDCARIEAREGEAE